MIKKIINYLNEDKNRKIVIFTMISAFICFSFAIYNGIIGIINKSIWNGSICFYYLLLLLFKILLSVESKNNNNNNKRNKTIILLSFILLFLITIAMIVPSILLIKNKRTYNLGLVPALATATFTTYSFIIAIINFKKAQNKDNQFIKQIRLISVISALMSILVLQNTLILVNGGMSHSMTILSSYSTFIIIFLIMLFISLNFRKYLKEK